MNNTILATERMIVSVPSPEDAGSFKKIWEDPDIMVNVGFPNGIMGLQQPRIADTIASYNKEKVLFDRFLKVTLREGGTFMGECKLGSPGVDRVS